MRIVLLVYAYIVWTPIQHREMWWLKMLLGTGLLWLLMWIHQSTLRQRRSHGPCDAHTSQYQLIHRLIQRQESKHGPCQTYTPQHELMHYHHFLNIRNTLLVLANLRKSRMSCDQHVRYNITTSMNDPIKDNDQQHKAVLVSRQRVCDLAQNKLSAVVRYVCAKLEEQQCLPYSYSMYLNPHVENLCLHSMFHLIERREGKLTKGGSSFQVQLQHGNTGQLAVCGVQDQFNGTYLIHYPIMQGCAEMRVIRLYHDFTAFLAEEMDTEMAHGEHKLIWSEDICSYGSSGSDKGMHLMHSDWEQQPQPEVSFFQAQRCISRLNSVTLIGGSNLRTIAEYILSLLGDRIISEGGNIPDDPHHHSDIHAGDIHFLWSDTTYKLTARLFGKLRHDKQVKEKQDVIVMMDELWDSQLDSLDKYMNRSLPQLTNMIRKMKTLADSEWRTATMIWVNNMAHPNMSQTKRNKVVIQVANAQAEK